MLGQEIHKEKEKLVKQPSRIEERDEGEMKKRNTMGYLHTYV